MWDWRSTRGASPKCTASCHRRRYLFRERGIEMDFVGLGGVRLSKIIELRGGMGCSNSASRNRSIALSGTLILVLFLPCLVLAQSYRGSIRGKVVDPSGSVIAGARITAKNDATAQTREGFTSADGAYVLAELPAGEYTIMAEAAGLSPVAQNVRVNL